MKGTFQVETFIARISGGNNEAFSYFSIVKHSKTQVSGFPESFPSQDIPSLYRGY